MKPNRSHLLVLITAALALLCNAIPTRAGCSDEEFLKAEELYQQGTKEADADKRIDLFRRAFEICPSHSAHAQGYYSLGKLLQQKGDQEQALKWLQQANRFKAVMLQRSSDDLADTNLLLGNLYRDRGEAEKALVHLNIFKALSRFHDKKLDQDFLDNADRFFSVIYSPATVKQILVVDQNVDPQHRPRVNRLEVYFDFGKATLDADARRRLDGIGEALQSTAFDRCSLIVEGHTDQVGGAESNCRLGKQRADAVVDYLRSRWSIAGSTLVPMSYGKHALALAREESKPAQWPTVDRYNRRAVIWNGGAQAATVKDLNVEFKVATPCDTNPQSKK
ncbi:MAG: OmpA family protein [Desulfomonile tiedjei]|nr:OmpA family protein [Desulfomonile tiedjei]